MSVFFLPTETMHVCARSHVKPDDYKYYPCLAVKGAPSWNSEWHSLNQQGWHIDFQPLARNLVFVDDVSERRIKRHWEKYPPAAVVETSPNNYQAWFHLASTGPNPSKEIASELSRLMCKTLDADPGGVGSSHFGKLPGFLNPKYRIGVECPRVGLVYQGSQQIDWDGELLAAAEKNVMDRLKDYRNQNISDRQEVRPLSYYHQHDRYQGDLHRADVAWAIQAVRSGLSEHEIASTLMSGRDLEKKGTQRLQQKYAERTARKAFQLAR